MNIQERDAILEELATLKNLNFIKIIREKNPEQDISAMRIGEQSIDKLASFWDRIILQLENELLTENYFVLPFSVNNHPYLVEFNLQNNLKNIKANLDNNNLPALFKGLTKNIQYQIEWGFWDRSERSIHNAADIDIKVFFKELELQKEYLEGEITKLKNTKSEIEKIQEELSAFTQTKKAELQEISTSLITVKQHKEEINTLLNQSNELKAKIQVLADAQYKNFEDTKNHISIQEKEIIDIKNKFKEDTKTEIDNFSEKQNDIEGFLKILKEKDEQYNQQLQFISGQKDFIEEKREDMIKLTGFAADAVLAHSFDKRAKEIKKGVNLWRNISGVLTALTVVWIFLLITNFCTDFKFETRWDYLLLNLFKSSPFFIALGFSLTQYSKERSLLEEYAFKAAVSLTINPYADKLDGTKDNRLKQQLIVDSISSVYSKPIGLHQRGENPSANILKSTLNTFLVNKEKQ